MFKQIINDDIEKIKNKRRDVLANNENLHKEIIKYKQQHTMKEVIKKFKPYIKTQQIIRDIVHYYFYGGDVNGYKLN